MLANAKKKISAECSGNGCIPLTVLTHFFTMSPFYTPPIKKQKTFCFFGVCRGYKMKTLLRNGFRNNRFRNRQVENATYKNFVVHIHISG